MPRTLKAILLGGLTVGTLDGLDALIFFGLRGAKLPRIFQTIAAELIGRGAYDGGAATVALGVLLHYTVATLIVTALVIIAKAVPALRTYPLITGPAYGIVAFLVMYLVVVPHGAIGGGGLPSGVGLLNAVLIHIFGVGVPAAYAARAAR